MRWDAPDTASTRPAETSADGSVSRASSPHTGPVCRIGHADVSSDAETHARTGDIEGGVSRPAPAGGLRCVVFGRFDRLVGGCDVTPRGRWVVARRAALAVVLGAAALLLSGCSWSEVLGLGWPNGITPEAHVNRELWIGSVIASLVVGVIVWGLIFWTSAFHRHKKGDTELPRQFG